MAGPVSFRVNMDEFTATLTRYKQFSKKDPKKICDTKAFFIARGAIRLTPKTKKSNIKSELGRVIFKKKEAVAMNLSTVTRYSRWGLEYAAPLAALIINARRGRASKKGLYGDRMSEAIRSMLSARLRSIAYIKSGWLPAIKTLFRLADRRGAPRHESGINEVGSRKKGFATLSPEAWIGRTIIGNEAWTKRDQKQALHLYGGPALQQAFRDETSSMLQYMEDKMRETARKAGIKTN